MGRGRVGGGERGRVVGAPPPPSFLRLPLPPPSFLRLPPPPPPHQLPYPFPHPLPYPCPYWRPRPPHLQVHHLPLRFRPDRDLHLPGCRRRQGLQGGLPLREVRLWLPLRLPQDPPVRPPPPPHFRLQEDLRALLSWTS